MGLGSADRVAGQIGSGLLDKRRDRSAAIIWTRSRPGVHGICVRHDLFAHVDLLLEGRTARLAVAERK